MNGRIALNGGPELYERIDKEGYDWIYSDYGIEPEKQQKQEKTRISIGSCAVRESLEGKK